MADDVPVEAMTYLRKKETLKELKERLRLASPSPSCSRRRRGAYFVEALKREEVCAAQLDFAELKLVVRTLCTQSLKSFR